MTVNAPHLNRRLALLSTAAALAAPSWAQGQQPPKRPIVPMTDGPFYPPRAWRERWTDWDADLTRAERSGAPRTALGEHMGLSLVLQDTQGKPIDKAEVEIWQCDALAAYHHPAVPATAGRIDTGFQGFGSTRSDALGELRFRTIKPVPYPGRTPHIHIKLRHASFGELSSQLFLAGDPGNAQDFLWRRIPESDRAGLALSLQAAPSDSGLRWTARHAVVLPG